MRRSRLTGMKPTPGCSRVPNDSSADRNSTAPRAIPEVGLTGVVVTCPDTWRFSKEINACAGHSLWGKAILMLFPVLDSGLRRVAMAHLRRVARIDEVLANGVCDH